MKLFGLFALTVTVEDDDGFNKGDIKNCNYGYK